MWLSAKNPLWVVILVGTLAGCGYSFSGQAPISLPQGQTLLCMTKFVNPSTESWLEPSLRAELRDEFTRRGQVKWVRKSDAQTLVTVRVISYNAASTLKGEDDATITSAINLSVAVEMYNAEDHTKIWTSGTVHVSRSFKGYASEQNARKDAVRLVAEKIADRLGQAF